MMTKERREKIDAAIGDHMKRRGGRAAPICWAVDLDPYACKVTPTGTLDRDGHPQYRAELTVNSKLIGAFGPTPREAEITAERRAEAWLEVTGQRPNRGPAGKIFPRRGLHTAQTGSILNSVGERWT